MATETRFHFAGFTYQHECSPFLEQWRSILWMDRTLPTPAARLFGRQAGVLMPALVKELVRTIRQIAPSQRGDGVDHLPKFPFRVLYFLQRFAECLLRSLPGYRSHRAIIRPLSFPDRREIPERSGQPTGLSPIPT